MWARRAISRIAISIAFFCCSSAVSICGEKAITLDGKNNEIPQNAVESSDLAELVDKIRQVTPATRTTFIVRIVNPDPDGDSNAYVSNAKSYLIPMGGVAGSGEAANQETIQISHRHIVLNAQYVIQLLQRRKSRADRPWSLIALIAHEMGHFENGHFETGTKGQVAESQADSYAGFILGRLGASQRDVKMAIVDVDISEGNASEYPSLEERRKAMLEGWERSRRSPKGLFESGVFSSARKSRRGGFIPYHGADIRGHDLCVAKGLVAATHCEQKCRVRDDCLAYSFDRWSGWCFLKSSLAGC